jgi:hypothetical protein
MSTLLMRSQSAGGWRQGGDEHMKPSVIVWDLETVPDLAGFAAAHDLAGKPDIEVREAIGDKFPKHIYHSIVCIGALIAHRESDHWAVDAVGAPHLGERTEKQLITAFCDKIAELSPQLVTFNGNSFDLPVLRYRAMVHGVSAPGLSTRPYFHRYTEDAVDLCDALSSFSSQGKATLHANTYQVWLRYELFRGTLGREAFQASQRNLADFMSARSNVKERLSGAPPATCDVDQEGHDPTRSQSHPLAGREAYSPLPLPGRSNFCLRVVANVFSVASNIWHPRSANQ